MRHIWLGITLVFALVLSACVKAEEFKVMDAWARPGNAGGNGAVYFIISNATDTDDTLLSASTDVASAADVHMSMMNANEVMTMRMQESVEVPAQGKLEFKPGGLHVMLVGLSRDLKAGDTITLTLNFENSGRITIQTPVKEP